MGECQLHPRGGQIRTANGGGFLSIEAEPLVQQSHFQNSLKWTVRQKSICYQVYLTEMLTWKMIFGSRIARQS